MQHKTKSYVFILIILMILGALLFGGCTCEFRNFVVVQYHNPVWMSDGRIAAFKTYTTYQQNLTGDEAIDGGCKIVFMNDDGSNKVDVVETRSYSDWNHIQVSPHLNYIGILAGNNIEIYNKTGTDQYEYSHLITPTQSIETFDWNPTENLIVVDGNPMVVYNRDGTVNNTTLEGYDVSWKYNSDFIYRFSTIRCYNILTNAVLDTGIATNYPQYNLSGIYFYSYTGGYYLFNFSSSTGSQQYSFVHDEVCTDEITNISCNPSGTKFVATRENTFQGVYIYNVDGTDARNIGEGDRYYE